ncbi:MAG: hypothetical protein HY303_13840, partial [Candidatus Wallbacteria bacterium]|nr:hypothetical protein [Candidatus Wallbacteria bacterium]
MQLLSKVLRMRPVLGLLAAAALLGLAEGALRVLPLAQALRPDWTPGGLVDHAVFWAPLGETDNPLGVARYWQPLRGAHPDQAPASGVTRVVCLGGSSTYGWPFEDAAVAYPARVQRRLGPRFDVLNAGEGGFTSFRALLYLESRLVHYKPAVVTFCFGANDGNDNSEI